MNPWNVLQSPSVLRDVNPACRHSLLVMDPAEKETSQPIPRSIVAVVAGLLMLLWLTFLLWLFLKALSLS